MPKSDFNKIALQLCTLWYECSPGNLLHIFETPLYKSTYEGFSLFIAAVTNLL